MKTLILLFFLTNLLPAQEERKEAIIDILELDESNTIGEGINLIRQAALKGDKFFALDVQLAEAHLEAKYLGRLSLRKVPVTVALKYLCDHSLTLSYEEGIWTIQPRSGEEGSDIIQVAITKITEADLAALGIFKKPGVGCVTSDGKKWPPIQHHQTSMIEDLLILRSTPPRIANFKALLALHRAGYKVPAIDSNQPAADE
ncbi:hypothetical protein V2O64_20010 [Verrucomicrobiaceae bacterium 227]